MTVKRKDAYIRHSTPSITNICSSGSAVCASLGPFLKVLTRLLASPCLFFTPLSAGSAADLAVHEGN